MSVDLEGEGKPLVLVGLMGCGKSRVSRHLAELTKLKIIDTDAEIEKETGLTIPEIFQKLGEPEFRRLERDCVKKIIDLKNVIIATGGGMFIDEENRRLLLSKCVVFYLKAGVDCLWNRIKGDPSRPLLQTLNPRRTLEDLLQKREPFYEQAHEFVPADLPPDVLARDIVALYKRITHGAT